MARNPPRASGIKEDQGAENKRAGVQIHDCSVSYCDQGYSTSAAEVDTHRTCSNFKPSRAVAISLAGTPAVRARAPRCRLPAQPASAGLSLLVQPLHGRTSSRNRSSDAGYRPPRRDDGRPREPARSVWFFWAPLVAKLKGARARVKAERGKCEGRKSHAERPSGCGEPVPRPASVAACRRSVASWRLRATSMSAASRSIPRASAPCSSGSEAADDTCLC